MTGNKSVGVIEQLKKYKTAMDKVYYFFLAMVLFYEISTQTPLVADVVGFIGARLPQMSYDAAMLLFNSIMNLRLLIVIPAVYTIAVDMKTARERISAVLLILLGWFYVFYMREWNDSAVLIIAALITASYGKDFRKIIQYYAVIICGVIGLAFILNRLGIIPEDILERDGWARHSFGMNGPTALSGHLCFVLLLLCFYRNGKLLWQDYLLITILTVLNIFFVDGKVAMLAVMLAMCGSLVCSIFREMKWTIPNGLMSVWRGLLCFSYVIIGILCMIMTVTYSEENFALFNKIGFLATFEGRFRIPHQLMEELPFSLFGNYYEKYYYVMHTFDTGGEYLFIDSSYARMYLVYGITGFVLCLVLCTAMQARLLKEKMTYRMFVLAIAAVFFVVQIGILDPTYSIFLLVIWAVIVPKEGKEQLQPSVKEKPGTGEGV